MCPDTEHLLSIIDGPAAVELAQHVSECAACRREMAAFKEQRERLRALPDVPAPPPSMALVQPGRPGTARRVALAASVLMAGVLGLWLAFSSSAPQQRVAEVLSPEPALAPESAPAPIVNTQSDEIKALTRRSAQLERQWQVLNRNAPSVQRVAHEATTAPLKSGLMQLDARYSELPEPKYWRQRVQLLDTLVTLEQTERLVRNDGRIDMRPALIRTL